MSQKYEIAAELRADVGKGASRRLRRSGERVPGILYGGGDAPQPIMVEARALARAIEDDTFFSHILTLILDRKSSQVIARDVQLHPATGRAMHIDFQRILADQEITVEVPIHFLNEEECVGVVTDNGLLTHNLMEVEVTCLPANLPESIVVDVANMRLGDAVHLSQLTLPPGVVITAFRGLDDEERAEHDSVVVSVQQSTVAAEVEAMGQEAAPIAAEVTTVKEEEKARAEKDKEG
jgi:large subunit ribosomal protein L25